MRGSVKNESLDSKKVWRANFFLFNPLKKPYRVHFLSGICKTAVDKVSNMTRGDISLNEGSKSIIGKGKREAQQVLM